MKTEPYIGITDFTSFEQVGKMLEVFRRHKPPKSRRILHVGVMMSYKTLNDIECEWTKVFPAKNTIAEIFGSDETINCLHYADYISTNVERSLSRAIEYGGAGINALQLDMVWPDPGDIRGALFATGKRHRVEVILQLGKNAIEKCHNNPEEVVSRLGRYEEVIHRVLLDKRMGQGLGMNATELIPFAQAIRDRFPDLGLVAAGGLGPDTMDLVQPLVELFPDISIDAESSLRPSKSILDPINWDMASIYLIEALELLR